MTHAHFYILYGNASQRAASWPRGTFSFLIKRLSLVLVASPRIAEDEMEILFCLIYSLFVCGDQTGGYGVEQINNGWFYRKDRNFNDLGGRYIEITAFT